MEEIRSTARGVEIRVSSPVRPCDAKSECGWARGDTALGHRVAGGAHDPLMDEIIVDHLEAHVVSADLSAEDRAAGAAELMAVIRRYGK